MKQGQPLHSHSHLQLAKTYIGRACKIKAHLAGALKLIGFNFSSGKSVVGGSI
jgi:hypothetical protein